MGFSTLVTAFSSNSDTWTTPKSFFDSLTEFDFGLDAAALEVSTLVLDNWYGPDHPDISRRDAFTRNWGRDCSTDIWLNPPYGRTIKAWMRKADQEAQNGATVVCLVPARTDTSWWHESCIKHEVRFIKGRLKFGNSKNSAPFPSALVIMNRSIK